MSEEKPLPFNPMSFDLTPPVPTSGAKTAPTWTRTDLRTFDMLTKRASSQDGGVRIIARIDMSVLEKRLGKKALEEMWAELQRKPLKPRKGRADISKQPEREVK